MNIRRIVALACAGLIATLGLPARAEAWDTSRPSIDRNADGFDSLGVIRVVPGSHDLAWFFSGEGERYSCHYGADICFGHGGDVALPGDYAGDGDTDLAVYQPGQPSQWTIRIYDDLIWGGPFGDETEQDLPVPADYDGDGATDIAVYRPGTPASTWHVSLSSGGYLTIPFGDSAHDDAPVPADFSCDGVTEIAVRRVQPNGDTSFIILSTVTGVVTEEAFGKRSDTYVPGDFDGDFCADLAVVRPMPNNNLGWFFRQSSAGYGFVEWGQKHDVPFPGDFNNDFLTDIGAYRVDMTGHGYARDSATGALIDLGPYGEEGDVLINAVYNQSYL